MTNKLATELTAFTAAGVDRSADLAIMHDTSETLLKSMTPAQFQQFLMPGTYNPLDFGADGSAAAIQGAIDQASTDGGGIVLIPPSGTTPPTGMEVGVWDVSSTSLEPKDGVQVMGVGVKKKHLFNCPDLGWTLVGGTILDGGETGTAFSWNTTNYGGAATFDASTDVVTATAHGLADGDRVAFATEAGTLPTNITEATSYYVITSTTNTFQLSTTEGGAALDFTTNGSGTINMARLTAVSNFILKDMGFIDVVKAVECGGTAHAGGHGMEFERLWVAAPTSGLSFASDYAFDVGNCSMVRFNSIHTYQQRKGTRIWAKHIVCSPGEYTYENFSHYMNGALTGEAIRGVTLEVQDGGTDVWQLDLARVRNGIVLTSHSGDTSDVYHYEAIGDTTSGHSVNNCVFDQVSSDGQCEYSFFLRETTNIVINFPRLPTHAQLSSTADIHIEMDDAPRTYINCNDNKLRINADINSVPSMVFGAIQGFGPSSRILQGMYYLVDDDARQQFIINGTSTGPGLQMDFGYGNVIMSRLDLTTADGTADPANDFASSVINGGLSTIPVIDEDDDATRSINLGRAGQWNATNASVTRTYTVDETTASNLRNDEKIRIYKKSGAGNVDVAFSGCTYDAGLSTTINMTNVAGRVLTLTYTGDAHFIKEQNW